MKRNSILLLISLLLLPTAIFSWGFYAHKKINSYSVYLLPPEMKVLFKKNIDFLSEHAVDPDMRRYAVPEEGPRHYLDIDHYGTYPYPNLPRNWDSAVAKFGEDSLNKHGIVVWHLPKMMYRLTKAFEDKNFSLIMKNAAEIGHYVGDMCVPLHASSNHNGQYTNQKGIHGFWESRVPELLADKEWDFFIGKAQYIKNIQGFCWDRILESALAADSVLRFEKELTAKFRSDQKYSFENRNGKVIKQYSTAFTKAFDRKLNGMVERRMRLAIASTASFWYTAWVNAGQPDLKGLANAKFSEADLKEFEELQSKWKATPKMMGRQEGDDD